MIKVKSQHDQRQKVQNHIELQRSRVWGTRQWIIQSE